MTYITFHLPTTRTYSHKEFLKIYQQENYKKGGDTFDILSETIGIITNKLISLGKKEGNDHLFIQIKTRGIDSFDFKSTRVIELGRKATKKHIKKIIKLSKA